ncbi:MAG: hypothetical protein LBQ20_12525 [Rhodanobacter sp.]|jgi:hypothetical protein|nr:hypothetical protein [Rhodanobacter sp.]
MREAWHELMFADINQAAKATHDPVVPAQRSKAALAKVSRHTLENGTPAHSFATLMANLTRLRRFVGQSELNPLIPPIGLHYTNVAPPVRW